MVDLAVGGLGPGELIGGGASSTVFAATRLAFGDRVAVKVLKQTLTDEQSRNHFQREAQALAELADIPGVVAVLDSGVNERGEPYLVFPLFEGSAQSDVNSNGAMHPARAATIVAGAARAVHGGHIRGVIHRDLKPANLLLTNSDDIFVSDFGIAKLTDSSASASGWLGLTPAYAPPEALEGISGGVPGDIYSLGATLAALVIGAPPFSSTGSESPIALLNRVVNEPAPDLVAHGAPSDIAAIVARAMAKSPAERHPTALAFAESLEAAVVSPSAPSTEPDPAITARLTPPPPAAAAAPVFPTAAPPAAVPPPAVPAPPAAVPSPVPPPVPSPVPPPAVPAPPAAVPPPAVPAPPAAVPPPSAPVPPVATPAAPLAQAGAAPVGPSFEPPPVLAASQGPAPLIPPAPEPATGGTNKVALGLGAAAVAAVLVIGGIFAFGGGEESAADPEPTAVVAEPTPVPEPTAPPEPTAAPTPAPAPTAAPTAVPTEVPTAAPTEVPRPTTPPLPALTTGGPIDVYPDGAGEVADLAAAVQSASDGDVIRLSAGVHDVGELVVVDKSISIIGAGSDQTTIVGQDSAVLFVEGASDVTIRGLSAGTTFVVQSADEESFGIIQTLEATDFVVEDVSIADSPGFGVVAIDSTGQVLNSTFTDTAFSGVALVGDTVAQLTNNTATGSGNSGFAWFDTSSGLAMGNTSDDNAFEGFLAQGSSSPNLVGNSATGNELNGFRMISTSAATLRGNRAADSGESGFAWNESATGEASGNVSNNNALSGFFAGDDAAPDVVANRAFDNTQAGFVWIQNAGGTASANRADGNGLDGFAAVDDATVTMHANYGAGNDRDLFLNESDVATIDEEGVIRVELDGSGDTDDIASAIARAAQGDVVVIGPGEHEVDALVQLDRSITIVGDSADTTSVNVASENTVLLVETVSVNLRDITLTSTYEPESEDDRFSIIELDRAEGFVVDDVVVRGSLGLGVGIFDSSGAITNSTFTESAWSGIGVAERSDVVIARNSLINNSQSGVVFFDAARGVVAANESTGNGFFGFSVQGAGSPEFVGNLSSSNESSGFAMAETTAPSLIGNTSTNNGSAGFAWFDTASGTARANVSSGNDRSGFGISGQGAPALFYNTATDNSVDGFTWFDTSSGRAVGNLATGNTFDGFAAEAESAPDLQLNVSRDNERFSFNRAADSNPVLADNEFE